MQLHTITRTKLSPQQVRGNHLRRQRLNDRLSAGAAQKLTVVSAPAGYGKSSLIADWLTTRSEPSVFVTLDSHDDDVMSFTWMMIGAIRTAVPDSMVSVSRLISQSDAAQPHMVGSTLGWDLDQVEPDLLIVLDDFQEIRSSPIHELIASILQHLPHNVHLIVSTREDPPLPLASLRAHGELTEIRDNELRFSLGEVQELVAQSLGAVDRDIAEALLERTEGWTAGLQLFMDELLLADRLRGDVQLGWLSGSEHAEAFLLEEVLARQSPEDQKFLMRTSVLEEFCGPLCDATLPESGRPGSAAEHIQRLRQVNCLIETLGSPPNWSRYHRLLRSALEAALRRTEVPAAISDLHARASVWLSDNGFFIQAWRQALSSGDLDHCARIMDNALEEILNHDDWPSLEQMLRLLPAEAIDRTPSFLVAKLWSLLFRNRFRALEEVAERLQGLLDTGAEILDHSVSAHYRGQLAVHRATLSHLAGRGDDACEYARAALSLLPRSSRFARGHAEQSLAIGALECGHGAEAERRLLELIAADDEPHPAYRARLLQALAYIRLANGDMTNVASTARQLIALATAYDLGVGLGWGHLTLALAEYELNRLESARAHFSATIAMRDRAHTIAIREASLGLAHTTSLSGNPQLARGIIAAEIEASEQSQSEADLLAGYSFQARVLLEDRQNDEAIVQIRALPAALPPGHVWDFDIPAHTRVRVLIAQGDEANVDAGLTELERLASWYESHGERWRLIQTRALQALAFQARGQDRTALDTLAGAVEMAEPLGLIRTFVDLGPPMATLMSNLSRRSHSSSYLSRLLFELRRVPTVNQSAPRIVEPDDAGLYETLTWREVEVLQLLEARLSNKEIATALTVSIETVKKHAANIYRKLDVDGRREAVTRARNLRLLPDPASSSSTW